MRGYSWQLLSVDWPLCAHVRLSYCHGDLFITEFTSGKQVVISDILMLLLFGLGCR